jgi:hypothetical protein
MWAIRVRWEDEPNLNREFFKRDFSFTSFTIYFCARCPVSNEKFPPDKFFPQRIAVCSHIESADLEKEKAFFSN